MPDNKPKGWFSRRHETNEAHRAAREHFATRAEGRPLQVAVFDGDKFVGWEKRADT